MTQLPLFNAILNGIALFLLLLGRALAKRKRVNAHRRVMLAAFVVSSLFLVCYVLHKVWRYQHAGEWHARYHGSGVLKTAYLLMLASHVLLAMAVPVLAVGMIRLGLSGNLAGHRRLARVAWPVWVYVSLTGVLIYLMLYPLNPR